MTIKKQNGTALLASIFFAAAVVIVGTGIIYLMRTASTNLIRSSNSDSLRQVTAALQFYALQNKDSLLKNKKINGFINPNSPTVIELRTQQYLTAEGVDITAPFQSTYKTTVINNPNGTITGFVFLVGNVIDNQGNPDPNKACGISKKIGDIGFCSSLGNSSLVGNGSVILPNPAGNNVATIAGSVFVPN